MLLEEDIPWDEVDFSLTTFVVEIESQWDDDLMRRLAQVYTSPSLCIVEIDGRWFIRSERFGRCTERDQVWATARQLVHLVNLAAAPHTMLDRLIRLRGVWLEDKQGMLRHPRPDFTVRSVGDRLGTRAQWQLSDPWLVNALLDIQAQNPDVAKALEMWSYERKNFVTLYKIVEAVRASLGKHAEAVEGSIARDSQAGERLTIRLFCQCAQHHGAVGLAESRHYSSDQPPKHQMELEEAQALVHLYMVEGLLSRLRSHAIGGIIGSIECRLQRGDPTP